MEFTSTALAASTALVAAAQFPHAQVARSYRFSSVTCRQPREEDRDATPKLLRGNSNAARRAKVVPSVEPRGNLHHRS
ncbi:hypothetical protein [Ostreiculturibacter nitratireducens]|uniref:hypothetical protein n=1 Tax=Ostreiculturibacter nitratireducens TaxID=3075226 RepID=UPI0031B567FF